jgi:hypothetical protein
MRDTLLILFTWKIALSKIGDFESSEYRIKTDPAVSWTSCGRYKDDLKFVVLLPLQPER